MKSLDWDGLRIPLLAAAEGSKIVVTSRSETAAKIMRAIRSHHLGTLSPEDSWSLFTKLAFPNGDSSAYPQLETIGREIVDKCQGLPLAVKALGSLLDSKADKREWEDILNSKTWHSQTDHEILPSFRLSYQHLSPPVKRCFAYCSIFAKDHEFDKKKLILLWMAEGLLHAGQRDERMEEVGEFCVQLEQYKVQKITEMTRHFRYSNSDDDRMVVFQKFEAVGEAKHLRTFLDEKKYPYFGFYTLRLREFPEIRGILKISNMENVVCVKDALQANMKDKRYLDELSLNWDEMISNDVIQSGAIDDILNKSFLNLGSLELSGCENCSTLPPLGQLPCLEHLEISNMKGVARVGSRHGEFPRLQKLFMWSCRKFTGELLIHLPSLKKLYLDRCPQLLVPTLNVSAACGLHLKRQACGFTALQTSDIEISNVSQLKQLPVVPHNLFIIKSDSVEEILQTNMYRCHHPVLKRLWINGGTYDNSLPLSFSILDIFPRLTEFKINDLEGLEKLRISISEGDPTSLRKLEIRRCPNLVYIQLPAVNSMYHEISNFSTHSSLQQLRLEDCPEVLFHGEGGCEDAELFPKECLLPSSLTSLKIVKLPNLKSLDSKGLQKLTSLVKLWIMDCPELQSLTEAGLHHLTSLEILNIHKCPKLQYLTKERLPDSLSHLNVCECPSLEQRCQFEKGPEWRHISHISKIVIGMEETMDVFKLTTY
ncbi:putative disease resistance protein RGA4 [Vitis vinifera]|uniref:Putative disease resistance protein RGA4 n=1 Tax=Vitis vinifera TaxID=29760 RepID=A0A438G075_VITVI|nr:putative disease resistance protein RGA4 [Vitis vinifera]